MCPGLQQHIQTTAFTTEYLAATEMRSVFRQNADTMLAFAATISRKGKDECVAHIVMHCWVPMIDRYLETQLQTPNKVFYTLAINC